MGKHYNITQEQHDRIVQAYSRYTGRGQVRDLAKRLCLPRWKVTAYAIRHGLIPTCGQQSPWCDDEIKILERNAHFTPKIISNKLKDRGFDRSETAVVIKRKRMRLLMNLKGQSARSLADCLGVDVNFVIRAIRAGKLKARVRGEERPDRKFYSYFITDKYAREYIINYIGEIDMRKCDKFWLVDLLTNGPAKQ